MRVEPKFEQHEDVWIPLYVPSSEPDGELPEDETPPGDHRRWARPRIGTSRFEERVAITGIGMSDIGRRLMRPPLSLTVDAVKAAVADAGLELDDIDGLSTYPGGSAIGGFGEGGVSALEDALGLRPTWYNGGWRPSGRPDRSSPPCSRWRPAWSATWCASGPYGRRPTRPQLRAGNTGGEPLRHGPGPARRRVPGSPALRDGLGRQQPGDVCVAPLPQVRHHPRDARMDRPQPAGQRRASIPRRSIAIR